MICDAIVSGQRSLRRKDCAGHQLARGRFLSSAVLSILAISIVFSGHPVSAAPPSDVSPRTESLDELLNSGSTSSQFDRYANNYGAQQIVSDARLAQQLAEDSKTTDGDAPTVASSVVKKHHLPPIAIGLLAVGAILVLSAMVLLIWSRIVQHRELRDAPSPMAFNYPRI
jgi:hypothetical protein